MPCYPESYWFRFYDKNKTKKKTKQGKTICNASEDQLALPKGFRRLMHSDLFPSFVILPHKPNNAGALLRVWRSVKFGRFAMWPNTHLRLNPRQMLWVYSGMWGEKTHLWWLLINQIHPYTPPSSGKKEEEKKKKKQLSSTFSIEFVRNVNLRCLNYV